MQIEKWKNMSLIELDAELKNAEIKLVHSYNENDDHEFNSFRDDVIVINSIIDIKKRRQ